MYTVDLYYNGGNRLYEHIIKITYVDTLGNRITVEGDDLFTHDFPLRHNLQLFSSNGSFKVSHENLVAIEITKES